MADSWDATLPVGSEAISNGDDRIREMKRMIQIALRGNATDGVEAKFPGSDTANPVFRYRGLKDITGNRPAAGQYGLFFDSTRNQLQRDNGVSWDDVGSMIPAGTVSVFYQASVPTGWTAVAGNDKFLRVVTGGGSGGSTGGTMAASTSLNHSHSVNSHTHDLANHTHTTPDHTHEIGYTASTYGVLSGQVISDTAVGSLMATGKTAGANNGRDLKNNTLGSGGLTNSTPSTNTSGATAPGTDSQLAGAFAYADVIFGSKN